MYALPHYLSVVSYLHEPVDMPCSLFVDGSPSNLYPYLIASHALLVPSPAIPPNHCPCPGWMPACLIPFIPSSPGSSYPLCPQPCLPVPFSPVFLYPTCLLPLPTLPTLPNFPMYAVSTATPCPPLPPLYHLPYPHAILVWFCV